MSTTSKAGYTLFVLLLLFSTAGFFLVRAIAIRSFTDSQIKVEAALEDRFNPYSSRYALSRFMGDNTSWTTYTSDDYNYQIKHPNVWNKVEGELAPGIANRYRVALADNVSLTVNVQTTFVMSKSAPKLKMENVKFSFYQDKPNSKSAVVKKDNLFYIIQLKQSGYFGTESEFKGTFYNILKTFEFTD